MSLNVQSPVILQDKKCLATVWESNNMFLVDVPPTLNLGLMVLEIDHSRVKVANLINFTRTTAQKVRGIGAILIQCAVVRAIEKGLTKVVLNSNPQSLFFYWKLGFRPLDEDFREKMQLEYQSKDGNSKALEEVSQTYNSAYMVLPKSSLVKWKALIFRDDNPLLTEKAFLKILAEPLSWATSKVNSLIFSYYLFSDIVKAPNTSPDVPLAKK